MADAVDRTLSEVELERGSLVLTDKQSETLGLARHSVEIVCRHGSDSFTVLWRAPERTLGGEQFAETLQFEGQIASTVRLRREDGHLELQIVRPSSSSVRVRPAPFELVTRYPTVPIKSPAAKKKVVRTRYSLLPHDEFDWAHGIGIHKSSTAAIEAALTGGRWDSLEVFELRMRGERLAAVSDFEELLSLDLAKVDHMPHQEAAAVKVLADMRGRAILADEVGLGKTIEAGIIAKELVVRGLVKRILVVCPATLREQWRDELDEKFSEHFEIALSGYDNFQVDRLIISLPLAARNVENLAKQSWDLLIVDEAHRLAGPTAKRSRELAQQIESRYRLFLTATPVQNDLDELYRLVELLRPGTFRSIRDFHDRFGTADKRTPKNADKLRQLIADVMVRTTRAQAGLDNVVRQAVDHPIKLSDLERRLYYLCTDLLRTVLNEPGDHFRRRHLAHRLTTSPRGLAISARRLAEHLPAGQARKILDEIADIGVDFGLTNRQKTLLRTCEEWTADKASDDPASKGKLIVFTQHTDTLEDLLRILDSAGIEASAFHGGMSATAKQRSIAAFRKHVPVLVSTDSGAEGLNLQFANCVVNYDLPWNPMRIEQRIGRVHRVTQKRNVFVANLYAVNTVDEDVYRILHDKLRMFELLFGQVTTVLGEMEDKQSLTFEGEVINAIAAANDAEMRKRIDSLGARVDAAYQKAQAQISTGSDLDRWLVDKSHRGGISKDGSKTLAPKLRANARKRQLDVEAFVRDYLRVMEADITFESPGFLSAKLSGALPDSFDRDELHLAFSVGGLDQHRDAELCAAGSEVFDAIIESLQSVGEVRCELAGLQHATPGPWLPHAPDLRFVERLCRGPKSVAAEASWRVRAGRADGPSDRETIVETTVGDPIGSRSKHHDELSSGMVLPRSAGTPKAVVEEIVSAARSALDDVRQTAAAEFNASHVAEQLRILSHYDARISEAYQADEIKALKKARDAFASAAAPAAEVRAELLGVSLVGSPVVELEEVWEHEDGRRASITFKWNCRAPKEVDVYDGRDRLITTVAMCADSHLVDMTRIRRCPSCDADRCDLCANGTSFTACLICEEDVCSACLSGSALWCATCGDAQRRADLDSDGAPAWQLGDAVLHVFEDGALLERNERVLAELSCGREAPVRSQLRAVAAALGLRPDVGLAIFEPTIPRAPAGAMTELGDVTSCIWSVEPLGGSTADAFLGDDLLPVGSQPRRHEPAAIQSLRSIDPPSAAPCLIAELVIDRRYLVIAESGFEIVTWRLCSGPSIELGRVQVQPEIRGDSEMIATAALADRTLEVHRCHRSWIVRLGHDETWFVPAVGALGEDAERSLEQLARSIAGEPATIRVADPPAPPTTFASPSGAVLVARDLKLQQAADEEAHRVPNEDDLRRLGLRTGTGGGSGLGEETEVRLRRICAGLSVDTRPHVGLGFAWRADETWQGFGRATISTIATGDSCLPVLADTGLRASNFGVCGEGHLHGANAAFGCEICGGVGCRACRDDRAIGPCASCGRPACGSCQRDPRPVAPELCDLCGSSSCADCGRTIGVVVCAACNQFACTACWDGRLCHSCSSLRPATREDVARLPEALCATGLTVRIGGAALTTVVAMAGDERRELAIVKGDEVIAWWTLVDEPVDVRACRLGATAVGGSGDVRLSVRSSIPAPRPRPGTALLFDSTEKTIDVTVRVGDREVLRREIPDVAERKMLQAARKLLDFDDSRIPEPILGGRRAEVEELVPASTHSSSSNLSICATTRLWRVELDVDGLHMTSGTTDEPTSDWCSWRAGLGVLGYDLTQYGVEPSSAVHASVGDLVVGVAGLGPHLLLLVRDATSITWQQLSGPRCFPDDLLLGKKLLGEMVSVAAAPVCDPTSFDGIVVADAERVSRVIEPEVLAPTATPTDLSTMRAAGHWLGDVDRPIWTILVLPADYEVLRSLVEVDDLRRHVSIGLRIIEEWRTGDDMVTVVSAVQPGLTRASTTTDDTGVATTRVVVDRELHLVERARQCAYCLTNTCVKCADQTLSCSVCEIEVCGRCQGDNELVLCRACAGSERLGILGRRKYPQVKKDLGERWVGLVGRDALHEVLIVATRDSKQVLISRDAAATRRPASLGRSVARLFNERTGEDCF